jgi:CheY-like chemotaxis protein
MSWRAQAAVAQAVDAEPAPVSTPASPGDTRSLRVLVVEDNEINRTIACALLARLGLDAEVAEDGEVALEKVVCGRYDLVLMDMRMPRMDGLESTRRMRALPLARQPRVFALTANAFEEDRQACLAAGMDGFLAKPYRLEQLAGVVADVRAWLRGLDPA